MGGGQDDDYETTAVLLGDPPRGAPSDPAGTPGGSASGAGASGGGSSEAAAPAAAPEHPEIVALRQFLRKLDVALGVEESAEPAPDAVAAGSQVMATSSMPRGTVPAQETATTVYMQDNVAVHPSSPSWQRGPMGGCLCLTKDGAALVMSWLPYPLEDASEEEDVFVHQQGVPMKEVAVADFHSVRRFHPALGYHYLIIALKSGLALPPLFFHSGGAKAFLSSLRLYAALSRSKDNRDVYLVNFVEDPLKKSLSQLGLPENVAFRALGSLRQRDSWMLENEDGDLLTDSADPSSVLLSGPGSSEAKAQKQKKKTPSPEDVALNVLEKLSFVTRFARDTTAQLIAGLMDEEPPVRKPSGEFREPDRSLPGRAVREEVGRWSRGSTNAGAAGTAVRGALETVQEQTEASDLERQPPLQPEEWVDYLDSKGRVTDPSALKKRIFEGGLDPSLRREVWKFLLGYHAFSSTASERAALKQRKAKEYETLRGTWLGIPEEEAQRRGVAFRDQLNAVEKDVTRTDPTLPFYEGANNPNVATLRSILTTYAFYNPELGYCQGMCDLLSPILYVVRDESETFWCFVALMASVGPNFHQDQNGMQLQLLIVAKLVQLLEPELHAYLRDEDCLNYFFCFRWIFLQFKREFSYEEVMRLWEILWSRHLSRHFHLFVCVAVLRQQKAAILEEQMDFETLLKFINDLSGKVSLEASVEAAQALCMNATELLA